jgi:hypothetical protein
MKQNLSKRMKPVKKMQPKETMDSITQKGDDDGNKADRSLNQLLKGNVFPSAGKNKKMNRPTGANKDRRNA